MKKTASPLFDVPVAFGQVGLGKTLGRIGIKIDRQQLSLDDCDALLCGKRVTGTVHLGRKDDSPGQKSLIEGRDIAVAASFDVNGFRVTPEMLGMSLSFNLESIELADVAKLSKGEGRFVAAASDEIPEDERLNDTGDDDDDDQRSLLVEGPWKEAPLADLFDGAMLKSLNKAGLKTVGDLAAWSASDKRLIDIPGIGGAKAEQIEETMERFWESNPGAGDEWAESDEEATDEEEEAVAGSIGKEAVAGA